MSVKQNFPTIKPTLNLDFANSTAVDSRITFTRASAATYTDAQGVLQTVRDNKPRIDFDATTGECRGLLIEEQRTNLLSQPVVIATGGVNVVTQSYTSETKAPDGTFSAVKITPTSNSVGAYYLDYSTGITALNAGTYTYSVWVKGPVGYGIRAALLYSTGGNVEPFFSFTGNWQKISVTKTYDGTASGSIRLHPFIVRGTPGSSADTGLWPYYFYMWNPQLEAGSFATSTITPATTFTSRASSATYFDSTGVMRTAPANSARYGYGYDSTTGKWISQGLVLEAAATNLFTTSSISIFNTGQNMDYYQTAIAAVDGTVGGVYKLTPTATSTSQHSVYKNFASSTPSTRCVSVYLKAAGYNYARIYCDGNSPTVGGIVYDLSTGTASVDSAYSSANRVAYGMENAGNGWYRCWVSGTATNADWYFHIDVANTAAFGTFAGDGSSGVYAWGPQMEIGSVPTSYIPTYGSSATRSADVYSAPATTRAVDSAVIKSSDFTKLNSSTAGTLYGEGTIISSTALGNGAPALVALSNSFDRDTHRFIVRRTNMAGDATYAGFNYRLATVIDGTSYSIDYSAAEGAQPEWEDAAVHKTIFGIDTTSQQAYGDGVSAGITSISVPNFDKFDQVEIGQGGSSSSWNGHIRKVTYYNKRLSNTQLQALTV